MAVPIIRGLPLLRHRLLLHLHPHHRLVAATTLLTYRLWSTSTEPTPPSDNNTAASLSAGQSISVLNDRELPFKNPRWDDLDFRKWKNKEAEILKDIKPVISAAKNILHSNRYLDGERLTAEDRNLC